MKEKCDSASLLGMTHCMSKIISRKQSPTKGLCTLLSQRVRIFDGV